MNETGVHKTVDVLLKLLTQEQWEVRHGGLLGIKYALAVRQVTNSVFERIFPLGCFVCWDVGMGMLDCLFVPLCYDLPCISSWPGTCIHIGQAPTLQRVVCLGLFFFVGSVCVMVPGSSLSS